MGCLKLTYHRNFLYVSKEDAWEKRDHENVLPQGEKKAGEKNCYNYYPGGAMFNSYVRENSLLNKYKYQHKEFQTDLGLEWFDFGPRQYDGWLLRTTTPDPHAENYYNWSNYSWEFGDPVRYGDPSGMDPEDGVSIGTLFSKAVQAVSDFVSFHFGSGNDGSAESANNLSEAHSTLETVGAEAQSMKAELKEKVDQIPGANVIGDLASAQQSKTSGEMAGNLAHAAGNLLMTPTGGGGKGGGKGAVSENVGRSGRQARLKELSNDSKVSSADRGWIKNEMRHVASGNRSTIRMPGNSRNSNGKINPGKVLAHPKGQRAKDGHSYKNAKIQDNDLHKLEHKHEGYQ